MKELIYELVKHFRVKLISDKYIRISSENELQLKDIESVYPALKLVTVVTIGYLREAIYSIDKTKLQ